MSFFIENPLASPPIRLRIEKTQATNSRHRTLYIDPVDGAAFEEEDLSPAERGHLYRWERLRGDAPAGRPPSGVFKIYSPYRVVDRETADLLMGCKSFLAEAPYASSYNDAAGNITLRPYEYVYRGEASLTLRRYYHTAWQTFSLNEHDFGLFRKRLETQGIQLEEGLHDVAGLVAESRAFRENARLLRQQAGETRSRLLEMMLMRSRALGDDAPNTPLAFIPTDADVLFCQTFVGELEKLQYQGSQLQSRMYDALVEHRDPVAVREQVLLSGTIGQLNSLGTADRLRGILMRASVHEDNSLHQTQLGVAGSLAQELSYLKMVFPVTSCLFSDNGHDLTIRVGDVVITVKGTGAETGDDISITGDIDRLGNYRLVAKPEQPTVRTIRRAE